MRTLLLSVAGVCLFAFAPSGAFAAAFSGTAAVTGGSSSFQVEKVDDWRGRYHCHSTREAYVRGWSRRCHGVEDYVRRGPPVIVVPGLRGRDWDDDDRGDYVRRRDNGRRGEGYTTFPRGGCPRGELCY